jgi:hypothetical protein
MKILRSADEEQLKNEKQPPGKGQRRRSGESENSDLNCSLNSDKIMEVMGS